MGTRTIRDIINEGEQGRVGNANQFGRVGSLLAIVPRHTGQAAVASDKLVLPDNAKAAAILRCYAAAGTVKGLMAPALSGTPATGNCAVTPDGNIVFAAADAVTLAEATYVVAEGDVIEEVIQVASSVGTLNAGRAASVLIEAVVLTGVVAGAVGINARGTATTTAKAAINDAGTGIVFHANQVVAGTARVKYIATPGVGAGRSALGVNLDAATRDF